MGGHCRGLLTGLLAFCSTYFFTKRCAFSRSTNLFKVYRGHSKPDSRNRGKMRKNSENSSEKTRFFPSIIDFLSWKVHIETRVIGGSCRARFSPNFPGQKIRTQRVDENRT